MAHWTYLLSASLLLASVSSHAAGTQRGGCVIIRATARYAGLGYNHVASVENQCSRAVECELSTDVDPEPAHVVRLQPRASADAVFRIASPAYEFSTIYRCRYR